MKLKIILCGDKLANKIVVIFPEKKLDPISLLLKLFMSSPACRKALATLSLTQGVKVDFTKANLKFQGCWSPGLKEIQVKENLPLEKTLQTFIFELCNAHNPSLTSTKLKYSNFCTADAYATYVEIAEYESFKKASLLYLDVVSRNPGALEMPSDVEVKQLQMLCGAQTHLEYVKTNGHYDYYIDTYNKAMWQRNNFFVEQNKGDLEKGKSLDSSSLSVEVVEQNEANLSETPKDDAQFEKVCEELARISLG